MKCTDCDPDVEDVVNWGPPLYYSACLRTCTTRPYLPQKPQQSGLQQERRELGALYPCVNAGLLVAGGGGEVPG